MEYIEMQYRDSKGLDNSEKISFDNIYKWIYKREIIGLNYLSYLKSIGIDYNNKRCIEVGKSKLDTLFKNKEYKTIILTNEKSLYRIIPFDRIIYGKLIKSNGKVLLYQERTLVGKPSLLELPNDKFDTIMINNFYSIYDAKILLNLSNEFNLVFGVYGNIKDKDKSFKIDQLKEIKRCLKSLEESYKEKNKEYYYVLSSKIK